MMLACNFSVQRYCSTWRSLASGIMTTGMSVGILCFPPWTEFLIREYNWRGALLINAGILLHGLPLSVLLAPALTAVCDSTKQEDKSNEIIKKDDFSYMDQNDSEPTEVLYDANVQMSMSKRVNNPESGIRKENLSNISKLGRFKITLLTYFELLKSAKTVLFILSTALIQSGHLCPYSYMPMRAVYLNISKERVALWLSITGIVGAFGRLLSGFIGNYLSRGRIAMYGMCGIITGGANVISVLIFNYYGLVAYGAVFGLVSGRCCLTC